MNKLIWKGKTAKFTSVYFNDTGFDIEKIKSDGYFEIEQGFAKGAYRLIEITKDGDFKCRLLEPE